MFKLLLLFLFFCLNGNIKNKEKKIHQYKMRRKVSHTNLNFYMTNPKS